MEDFEIELALNGQLIKANVHPHIEGESTWYDVVMPEFTLSIYKEGLYTWKADSNQGLDQDDIQSIGEQIINA
jgi:hypothetical protein